MLTPKELCCPVLPPWVREGSSEKARMREWEEDGAAALIAASPPEGSCLFLTHSSFPVCILSPAVQWHCCLSARLIVFRPLWTDAQRGCFPACARSTPRAG